jgi:hypothetical protein
MPICSRPSRRQTFSCSDGPGRPGAPGVAPALVEVDAELAASLGPGTTPEHARGRGCNTALLRRRLIDAAEAGCHTVFVELGEYDHDRILGTYRNLRRAGFEEAYESRNWQRPALHPARIY